MNIVLSTGTLVVFLISILTTVFFLIKQGQEKLKFSITSEEGKGVAATLLAFVTVIGLRAALPTGESTEIAITNIACLFVAFSLPFLLRRANCSYEMIALLLLILTVSASCILSSVNLLCVLLGLLIYKTYENLIFANQSRFDDLIPSCVWLTVLCWANLTGRNYNNIANILLCSISISLLLRPMLPFCLTSKYSFLKRVLLSIIGGLALLVILAKVLLLTHMGILAAFFGASLFFSCLFEQGSFGGSDTNKLSRCTQFLVLLGMLTLAATRLSGDIGLVVLPCASLICLPSNMSVFAGLFWIGRLLTQGFITSYVSNVTGINLMHAYCSAAEYFGFLGILFAALILQIDTKKHMTLLAILMICVLAPPALIYLIHEEPSSSFLIAANVAAIAIASFTPSMFKDTNVFRQGNLLLLPLMMTVMALLSSPLITIGNSSSVGGRLDLVSALVSAWLVVYLIWLFRNLRKPVKVSGNQS